tara:strand:+ start:70 stop:888 length:819 start_codon:yes stop_codon:yes gene_type:complete
MKNILLPTDFSVNANRAIRYAFIMFGKSVKYTLLNTHEMPHSGTTMLISIADILRSESQNKLHSELQTLVAEFPHLDGQIDTLSEMGVPETVVKHLTEEKGFDMVVMGTTGASGIKEVLVGSVASNVMQHVVCPVLAIPESAELSVPAKILFAIDDELLIRGVFPTELANLVQRFDAHLLILNVVPDGELDAVGSDANNQRKPTSVFGGVKHSFHFIEGNDLNAAITTFAKENKVDLLAMVTKKTDFFSKLFGRSTTKKMMQHIDVPIIAFH